MANNQQHSAQSAVGGSSNPVQLASSPVEGVWDEERLENAMETLKEMHIQVGYGRADKLLPLTNSQLRNLRTTIPRLIAPLTVKQLSRTFPSVPGFEQHNLELRLGP